MISQVVLGQLISGFYIVCLNNLIYHFVLNTMIIDLNALSSLREH